MTKYHIVSQNWNIFVKRFVNPKFFLVPVCFRNSLLKRQSGFSSENEFLSLKSLSCFKLWGDMISMPFFKKCRTSVSYMVIYRSSSANKSTLLRTAFFTGSIWALRGTREKDAVSLSVCRVHLANPCSLLTRVTCGTYSHQGFDCF